MTTPFSNTLKLMLAVSLFAVVNCSNQKLSSAPASSGSGTNNGAGGDDATGTVNQPCQDQLKQITIPVKVLFIVDVSGSNASNGGTGYVGTDNGKAKRAGALNNFKNLYASKTNFHYSFTYFSGQSSSALIGYNLTTPAFTQSNDAAILGQAITTFQSIPDSGETPYVAALDMGAVALQNDTIRTSDTKWSVIFISDGMPNPDVPDATLVSKVQAITSKIPGQVTFSTIYYGPNDQTAAARLNMMAQAGGGKFLDANTSTGYNFQITDVITVPGTACQ